VAGTHGKNGILVDYHMSFVYYVNIAVAGYLLGAVASFVTGVADKVGRVNIITAGLFVVALLSWARAPVFERAARELAARQGSPSTAAHSTSGPTLPSR
jgi:hypothetical protein